MNNHVELLLVSGHPSKFQIVCFYLYRQKLLAPVRLVQLLFEPQFFGKIWRQLRRFRRNVRQMDTPSENNGEIILDDILCHTDRLVIRQTVGNDLEGIFCLVPPEGKAGGLEFMPFWRRELSMALELTNAKINLTVLDRSTEEIVGHFGMTEYRLEKEIENELGYRIHYDQQGKGLATEAAVAVRYLLADKFGIRRLVSVIDPNNHASIRVAEKNGMKFEKECIVNKKRLHIYS